MIGQAPLKCPFLVRSRFCSPVRERYQKPRHVVVFGTFLFPFPCKSSRSCPFPCPFLVRSNDRTGTVQVSVPCPFNRSDRLRSLSVQSIGQATFKCPFPCPFPCPFFVRSIDRTGYVQGYVPHRYPVRSVDRLSYVLCPFLCPFPVRSLPGLQSSRFGPPFRYAYRPPGQSITATGRCH